MTEHEAEAWVARLTRIWGAPPENWWNDSEANMQGFFTTISGPHGSAELTYYLSDGKPHPELENQKDYVELLYHEGRIIPCYTNPSDEMEYASPQALHQFTTDWLDLFRRNCWLSGANIEATAHEKAEWLRGFTQEEIKSWNLEF